MINPISPSEVVEVKKEVLPEEVINQFNRLIAIKWNGHSATILQKDIVEAICSAMHINPNAVFLFNYLDVEDIYRDVGWTVEYHKPAYNETGNAYFIFSY